MMDGIINVNKPAGVTSHRIVAGVRRLAPGVKVGHAGTLDPAATGVLPLCLGRATRIAEYIMDLKKGYRASIALGVATATGDAEGAILSRKDPPPLEKGDIENLFSSLTGMQQQETPAYSAAKYRGRPLYDYARRGETVPVKKRTIHIYRFELLDFYPEKEPQIICEVECSRGTYIRVLAEEVGRRLGCGAHLQALERLFVGPFHIGAAHTPGELERAAAGGVLGRMVLPMDLALTHFVALHVSDGVIKDLRDGRKIPWGAPAPPGGSVPGAAPQPLRVYDRAGLFRALAGFCTCEKGRFLKTIKFLAP